MNFVVWLIATIAMFKLDNGAAPFVAGTLASAFIAVVHGATRQNKLGALVAQYTARYGKPPPGFDTDATQIGGVVGAGAGNYVAGGLIGAAIDGARHLWKQQGMSAEQKALHNQISALQAWSPWHSTFMVMMSLGMSWGALWVAGVVNW